MVLLWRRLDLPGHEWCHFASKGNSKFIKGLVLLFYERKPCRIEYEIRCDSSWKTISAELSGHIGIKRISLQIKVDSKNRWFCNGKEIPEVEGCFDIDLGFSPSTNALPINRLKLPKGIRVGVAAVWVEFPSMKIKRLSQTYMRLAKQTIYYESAGGRFKRNLEINRYGFVTNYPDYWKSEEEIK